MNKQSKGERWAMETLGKIVAQKVIAYMKDPLHKAEFESWYLKQHGKPYQWKQI